MTHWNVYRQGGQGTVINSSQIDLKNIVTPKKVKELNFVSKFRKQQADGSKALQPMIFDKDATQLTL